MNYKKEDIPKQIDDADKTIRRIMMGEMDVSYSSVRREIDLHPMLKGLPNDSCQMRHWGYVLKGGLEVEYGDRKETYREGDLYYMSPGHVPRIFAGTEVIEFAPVDKAYEETMGAMGRNMAKMQKVP
jgi:hypothetical protein